MHIVIFNWSKFVHTVKRIISILSFFLFDLNVCGGYAVITEQYKIISIGEFGVVEEKEVQAFFTVHSCNLKIWQNECAASLRQERSCFPPKHQIVMVSSTLNCRLWPNTVMGSNSLGCNLWVNIMDAILNKY